MHPDQISIIVLTILGSGFVTIFLFFLIRGLKLEIQSLNMAIETQNQTLEIVEKRIAENEKVGNIYKNLIDELPIAVDKYKEIIRKTKETVIEELEKAKQSQDEKLKQVAELRLKEIEVVQPIITQLSSLSENLHYTMNEVRAQLRSLESISHMAPTLDLGLMWSRLKAHEESGLGSHSFVILSGGADKGSISDQFRSSMTGSGVPDYKALVALPTNKKEDKKIDK
jgi:Na+-transporting methylmalonyl-CoA/oxaloacetate decarboxylase gamma subunit